MVMIAPIIAAVSAQAVIAANKRREIERLEEEAAEKAKIDALEKRNHDRVDQELGKAVLKIIR